MVTTSTGLATGFSGNQPRWTYTDDDVIDAYIDGVKSGVDLAFSMLKEIEASNTLIIQEGIARMLVEFQIKANLLPTRGHLRVVNPKTFEIMFLFKKEEYVMENLLAIGAVFREFKSQFFPNLKVYKHLLMDSPEENLKHLESDGYTAHFTVEE